MLIMMMPTRTLTLKSPQPEGIADKESSPEPDRMNQYRNALDDYIKDNVYEGMIGVEWQVVARGISKYSPDEGEDPTMMRNSLSTNRS